MSIRDDFLEVLDEYRGQLHEVWDLRRYDVSIVVTTWTGALVGEGTATPVETPIVVDGDKRPKVEQLSQKDILASNGLYQDQDLKVGPLTPSYGSGGIEPSVFDPAVVGSNVDIGFKLVGPGMPEDGAFFSKVGQEVSRNFGYSIILRRSGTNG